jgi:hypothetical protein
MSAPLVIGGASIAGEIVDVAAASAPSGGDRVQVIAAILTNRITVAYQERTFPPVSMGYQFPGRFR